MARHIRTLPRQDKGELAERLSTLAEQLSTASKELTRMVEEMREETNVREKEAGLG